MARHGWTLPPALVLGEEVRFAPEGPWCKVARITPCAAYVRGLVLNGGRAPEPEPVVIPEKLVVVRTETGTKEIVRPERVFTPTMVGKLEPVSVHSFVYERR